MSSVSPQDHLNPHDPNYYAPRWLRERTSPSLPTPAPEPKSERFASPTTTPPRYDALLEEAVAESLRHPLDPDVMTEPEAFANERDRRRALFGVAGRFAAAIGVSAIVALFFVIMVPVSRGQPSQVDGALSSMSTVVKSIKTAFSPAFQTSAPQTSAPQKKDSPEPPALSDYRTTLVSTGTAQPAASPEESDALLQKFLQWQQKPSPTAAPNQPSPR